MICERVRFVYSVDGCKEGRTVETVGTRQSGGLGLQPNLISNPDYPLIQSTC